MAKTYSQYCPVAHALDLVGERWSLLIVRELQNGPLRYTDLADSLRGCGTNILAARLKDLDAAGIVRKTKLPPPAASTVYELTQYGRELEEVLHALGRWGARSLGPPSPDDLLRPGWSLNMARCTFRPEAARGFEARYELRFPDDEVMTLRVYDAEVEPTPGPAGPDVDLVLETDPPTMFELVAKTITPREAVASGRARIEGELDELDKLVALFSFEPVGVDEPAPV
jgi:DNA-binding HxlR family transcriptional regulator